MLFVETSAAETFGNFGQARTGENSHAAAVPKASAPPKLLSLETFFEKYRDLADGFKYEYNEGIVEKSPRTMNPAQIFIANNLLRAFLRTQAFADGGAFFSEIEMSTAPRKIRKPDLAYRTPQQVASGDFSLSEFGIEVISTHDKANKVLKKLEEYFAGGMKVLWLIYPEVKKVYVHRSPTAVEIFADDDLVTASPVLPDFQIKVSEIFRKPTVG